MVPPKSRRRMTLQFAESIARSYFDDICRQNNGLGISYYDTIKGSPMPPTVDGELLFKLECEFGCREAFKQDTPIKRCVLLIDEIKLVVRGRDEGRIERA